MARVRLVVLALVISAGISDARSADAWMAQSPEGLVVAREGDLYAVALATGDEVRLTRTRAWETAPAVSPDGQTIVYQRAPEQTREPTLWTMQFDGSRQSSLGVRGGDPDWTPSGNAIYFTRGFCCEIC